MLLNPDKSLIWQNVFQFPKERGRESMVWRKYAPDITDVHKIGCEKEQQNPGKPYRGAITAQAERITAFRTANGHGFFLEHRPEEGQWHAEIGYDVNSRQPFTKNDKAELKQYLQGVFAPLEPHSC